MLIRELHLRRFGHFTDAALKFLPEGEAVGAPGLHIVFGANEAGKTTALHALRYCLYGIPDLRNDPRTYDFQHKKADLRIAMLLESAKGKTTSFTRRKKTGESTFAFDDSVATPDAQAQIDGMLYGVDSGLFCHKYGIDYDALRKGGAGLAGDDKGLGESLFAAATGITSIRETLAALALQLESLLASSGRGGSIHAAVKAFTDARTAANKAKAAGRKSVKKSADVQKVRDEVDSLNAQLSDASAILERTKLVHSAAEKVVQRQILNAKIDELGDVFDKWSRNLETERIEHRDALKSAQAHLVKLNSDRELLHEDHTRHSALVDEKLRACADRVANLTERVTEYVKAKAEEPRLATRLEQAHSSVLAACQAIKSGAVASDAAELLQSRSARETAATLLGRYERLLEVYEAATQTLLDCEHALEEFSTQQPAHDNSVEGLDLVRSTLVRDQTVDTARLAQLEEISKAMTSQLENAAKSLPRCDFSVEQLLSLPVPLTESIEAFDEKLLQAQQELKRCESNAVELHKRLADVDTEIAAKSRDGVIPTKDQLAVLRSRRDALWARIRTAWTGTEDGAAASVERGDEAAVGVEYESAVAGADVHADAMVAAGEAVGEIASLQRLRDALVQQLGARNEAFEAAKVAMDAISSQWQALWTAINVEAGSVKEMRAWLIELRDIREMAGKFQDNDSEANGLRTRVERSRNDLIAALDGAGTHVPSGELSVEVLRQTAEALIEQSERALQARIQRDADRKHLDSDLLKARSEKLAAQAKLDVWAGQWGAAAPAIGLDAQALPEAGKAMLESMSLLETAIGELATAKTVHDDTAQIVASFETGVREILEDLDAPLRDDLARRHADNAVRELAAASTASAQAADKLEQIDIQLVKVDGEIREHQDVVDASTIALEAMAKAAGYASVEELEDATLVWSQRKVLRDEASVVDREIVEVAAMAPDVVVAHLGDTQPEAMPGLIRELKLKVDAALSEYDAARKRHEEGLTELGELQKDAELESHLARMDDARAQIEQLSGQYVPLKLQHEVLSSYLRDQAGVHMGPAMMKASEIFEQLTCGAYSGITQDVDEKDNEVLRAIAVEGEKLGRSGLSTGTADQLYLALRLASIYQHLDVVGAEPIPFIVDDILTTFDDERSAATMRVLGELAQRTQVIFFTHHQHLVDLAQREVPAEVLYEHRLGAQVEVAVSV